MKARRFPLVPRLEELSGEAAVLHAAIRSGDPAAVAALRAWHPEPPAPDRTTQDDARLVLARSYQAPSWERIEQACGVVEAIWKDDAEGLEALIVAHPELLHDHATIRDSNWGPPMTYAANVGRDRIITMLDRLGAKDHRWALGRALLQSREGTARMLHQMMGRPKPPPGAFGGPAYTLSVTGTELLFEFGAELVDEAGQPDAPVDVVLETDSRKPEAKHRILELYAEHGFPLPDTPVMALHRGRIDLLEAHLARDPGILTRTFGWPDIYPPDLRCRPLAPGSHDEQLPRTPIADSTLLHIAVEFDELDIARWLLDQGMHPDVPAAVDPEGFGGHTALFGAVVSYPHFWMNYTGGWAGSRTPENARFAELLLDRGADPNARASLRQRVASPDGSDAILTQQDLTPTRWGEDFENKIVVSAPALRLIAERGGHR